jgi:hypothetical protein
LNDENTMLSSLTTEHVPNRATLNESKHKEERGENEAVFVNVHQNGTEGVTGARQVHHYVSPNSSKTFQNFFKNTSVLNLISNQKVQSQHALMSSSMNPVDECEEGKLTQTSQMSFKGNEDSISATTASNQKPLVRRRSIENVAESVSLQQANLVSQESGNWPSIFVFSSKSKM